MRIGSWTSLSVLIGSVAALLGVAANASPALPLANAEASTNLSLADAQCAPDKTAQEDVVFVSCGGFF